MASTTTDRQSFMIDGRRIWLVAGTIPYARLPRDLWAPRIRAARDAGLNCIETPVIWGLHETREGAFDFEGDLDLAAYIDLIGQAGMYAIVRLGPYVGPGWDLGGIPAWLAPEAAGKLRSSAPEFLGPCARYISAVCAQIKDQQISVSRKGKTGPIILVQNENRWFCGDPKEGAAYLGELDRYIRESGMTTPIINTNNLYHVVEGEIAAWTTRDHFHSTTRQLHVVEPKHPALAVVPASTVCATWGQLWGSAPPTGSLMRALAEVLASGGQYILKPFHAGPLLGFAGGRYAESPSAFATADPEPDAPLDVSGARTARYDELRRISLFASHFGRVLANMDPEYRPVVVGLEPTPSPAGKPAPGSVTAVDCRGSQGSIVFVFAPPEGLKGTRMIWLTLDDGSELPVTLGADPVTWVMRDVHLVDRATLDHCNLSVVALVGQVLVCYGPAGAPGLLSINGSSFEVDVPKGVSPTIEQHEGITLIICNETTINQVAFASDAVHIGAQWIDDDGVPIRHPRAKKVKSISAQGKEIKVESRFVDVRKGSVAIRSWACADCSDYVDGSADRFASINGPTTMERLGAPSGYGWLRLQLRSGAAQKVKTSFLESGDRLHLYMDGVWLGIAGVGPGAVGPLIELPIKKGEQSLSILVDNQGRLSEGIGLGESKGLYGHLWQVAPLRTGAGKIQTGDPLAPLSVRSPIFGLEMQDVTDSDRMTWTITHRKKAPIFMTIDHDPGPGVVLVNDEVVQVLNPGGGDRLVLDVEHQLKRGVNVVQIAITGEMASEAADLKKNVSFYEGKSSLSEKARWSFAKWEQPAQARFKDMPKGKMTPTALGKIKGSPHWWRGEFSVDSTETPLFFDASGMSKGQIFLNGKNVGRYFAATHTGKETPPQTRYYLPDSWINTDKPNELVIFDEHGFGPAKTKLVYGSSAEVG